MWAQAFLILLSVMMLLGSSTMTQISIRKQYVASQESNQSIRLPSTFRPLHYVINLVPHIVPENFTFDGEVHITGLPKSITDKIVLHFADLQPTSVKVDSLNPQRAIQINFTDYNSTTQMYTIYLKETLKLVVLHNISIKYIGNIRDDMFGLYRSWYTTAENKTRWIAVTQLEPTHARRVFPCFDEPALKSTFQINVARTPDMHTISNMPFDINLGQSLPEIPGRVWDCFAETPPMPPYLVAILISDFKGMSTYDGKFASWSQKLMSEQTEFSLQISPSILQTLENYTALSYTIPKMDQVAIPDFSSAAMENWGMVTYGESMFLLKEGVTSSSDKQRIVHNIAHEFAHVWFGNLVTPSWWKDVWLSEGFATYLSYYVSEQVLPSWHALDQFVSEILQPAMDFDSGSTKCISSQVHSTADIVGQFDLIAYDKAASILRQTEHFLTHRTFQKGIRMYLNARQYLDAEPKHLFYALNEAQREDKTLPKDFNVHVIMHTWMYQKGLPVIHVHRSKDNIRIKQERFFYNANLRDNSTWWIPVSYTTSEECDFHDSRPKAWLKGQREMKLLDDISEEQWIILNVQATGYYRVNYDDLTWTLLTQHMRNCSLEFIHPLNRGQLVNDAFTMARVGLLNYTKALDLSEYLRREKHLVPWMSFYNVLPYLYLRLYRTETLQPFKKYVLELLEPLIWKATNGTVTEHMDKLLLHKTMQWACKFDHPDCMEMAIREFRVWSIDPMKYRFDADFQQILLCTVLRHGAESEFDLVWNYYLQADTATEKASLLTALGCTSNSTRYLNKLKEMEGKAVRKKSISGSFKNAWSDPSKVPAAIDFFKNYLHQLNEPQLNREDDLVATMFEAISEQITQSEELAELAEMLKAAEDKISPSQFKRVKNSLNDVHKYLEWNKQYVQDIQQWLNLRRSLSRHNPNSD